jgi:hypothetical protein
MVNGHRPTVSLSLSLSLSFSVTLCLSSPSVIVFLTESSDHIGLVMLTETRMDTRA